MTIAPRTRATATRVVIPAAGIRPCGPPGTSPADRGLFPARRRYLKGQCPESIPVGKPFSLLASIVLAGPASAGLKPFDVPPEGRDVLLVVHAPGLRLLGDQRQTVHVPADGDSEPVMFELRADTPGPRSVSITAWIGGSYLGELLVEITAERDRPPGPHREVLAEITTEPTEGAVSLVVRYDPSAECLPIRVPRRGQPRRGDEQPGLRSGAARGAARRRPGRTRQRPQRLFGRPGTGLPGQRGGRALARAGSRAAARAILGPPAPDTAADDPGRQGRGAVGAALPAWIPATTPGSSSSSFP